jgi:hypothetical protein
LPGGKVQQRPAGDENEGLRNICLQPLAPARRREERDGSHHSFIRANTILPVAV